MTIRSSVTAALAALAVMAGGARVACAHDAPDPRNRVSFQVERSREVANDWARAVIGITAEDTDSARLADQVNREMQWGLATAKAAAGIQVESGGYTTSPIDRKGEIRRWRSSQDLVLETADVAALTELLGKLQSRLQLRSIDFSISPEKRRGVEDELIDEALAAYQARAKRVAKNLGASGYEIVQISVHPSGGHPPGPVYRAEARAYAADSVTAPALEGGQSRLSVSVNGSVELR